MLTFLSRPYLTLFWTITILKLTLTPAADMPDTPDWQLLSFDTAAHAGVFAVLALLAWLWLRQRVRHPALVVLAACVVLGALIEVLQYYMALGRHAEWSDLLSDTIGTVLALALAQLGNRLARPRPVATAALLLAALAAHAQPDLARARATIAELASEKMHGRGYVQQGEHVAAAYLRTRLRALGLQPLAPDYTQPFGLDVNTFPGKVELTANDLEHPERQLRSGTDFILAPQSAGTTGKPVMAAAVRFDSLVFVQPLQQQVFRQRIQTAATLTRIMRGRSESPFLVLTAREEQHLSSLPLTLHRGLDSIPNRIILVPKLTASLASQAASSIRIESLDTLAVWKLGDYHSPMLTLDMQLDARLLHDYQTQNLAAVVRGSAQSDSFVVVTAHYDHLGMMGRSVYFPGANDNASGVALLLELAAHYAQPQYRPRCSVAFLLFGAEEAGLVGSRYFVAHPLLPLARIKFLVNLDLLGTGEDGATVVNGKVYEAAYQHLAALNAAHHYLPKLGARGRAANSDHYPFSEVGVPAFFLYTRGGSTAYHDVNDRPAALSLAGFAGAYGLVRDFLDGEGAAPVTAKSPDR